MIELDAQLLRELEAGGTVVVPTQARATAVLAGHAAAQVRAGRTVWRTPDVLPWDSWLEREGLRALGRGEAVPRTLGRLEEWFLWRDAVAEAAEDFPRPEDLVEPLRRAARLVHEWELPLRALSRDGGAEAGLLARVLAGAERRFADARAEPSWRLSRHLAGCSSPTLIFAGFLEVRPDRRRLAGSLEASGSRALEHVAAAGGASSTQLRLAACADPQREIERAAAWARARLLAEPEARLLVVVPDLAGRRRAVERAFAEALAPAAVLGQGVPGPLWTVEGSRPLGHFAATGHALTAFRFIAGPIDFAQFSDWLRGAAWPRVAPAQRARLDLWLRTRLGARVDAGRVLQELRDPAASRAPADLHDAARDLHALLSSLRPVLLGGPAALSVWAVRFRGALALLGWGAGQAGIPDDSAAVRSRLLELLSELALLPGSGPVLDLPAAVDTLRSLAAQAGLESAAGDAAVTVTAGMADPVLRYDGIWVAGLHADAWPGPVRIDPFVPLAAQRQAGIAEASASTLVARARRLMERWSASARELVVSWPTAAEDCALLPSPLVVSLRGAVPLDDVAELRATASTMRSAAPDLERLADPDGTPWAAMRLPGGARAVELQMRCPQRAYAELRLGAAPLEAPGPGIDARERGMLLHSALEILWREHLHDSARLAALGPPALDDAIATSVDRALEDVFGRDIERDRRRAVRRERERALRIIGQLCALDRARAPFRPVQIEQGHVLRIDGVELRLTVDRVDELEDGSLAIIDYKAGPPRPQDWLAARIESPQLLLYLAAVGERVRALATMHLTPAGPQARGIADRSGRLPGVRPLPATGEEDPWASQALRWRESLGRAVRDLRAGRAVVDPLPRACDFCHLHGFCRVDDAALPIDEAGDEPD